MKLTRLQQLGLVSLLAGLADESALLETLDTTGEAVSSAWMRLPDDQKVDIINVIENGLCNIKDALEALDSEFK